MHDLQHFRAQLMAMLAECETTWAQWPPDKRASMIQVMQMVLACYLNDDQRAVMLVTKGGAEPESVSLVAINAEDDEIQDLVDTLCVFRRLDSQPTDGFLN